MAVMDEGMVAVVRYSCTGGVKAPCRVMVGVRVKVRVRVNVSVRASLNTLDCASP